MGLCISNKRSLKEEGLAFIRSNKTKKDDVSGWHFQFQSCVYLGNFQDGTLFIHTSWAYRKPSLRINLPFFFFERGGSMQRSVNFEISL